MLAHEQFTVPRLVKLGALANHSGFDLLARVTTSSLAGERRHPAGLGHDAAMGAETGNA